MIGAGERTPVPVKPKDKAVPLTSTQAVKVVDRLNKKNATFFTPKELADLTKRLPPETPMKDALEVLKHDRKKKTQ
jgi:hypothetical protein